MCLYCEVSPSCPHRMHRWGLVLRCCHRG
jgi:hypothetical protein